MRYAPDAGLVFIHIPKNGGQSVRNALMSSTRLSYEPLAQDLGITPGEAEQVLEKGFDHETLGPVHPAHLTLQVMKDHFPSSWEVFSRSKSFALLRDPRDRFLSALLQRLGEFKDAANLRPDDPRVGDEALHVIEHLSSGKSNHLLLEFIHFTRQTDFIELEGQQIVTKVFRLDQTHQIAGWLTDETGLTLSIAHDHARRQPKPWAKNLMPVARFIGRNILPPVIKKSIYSLWVNGPAFNSASNSYKSVAFPDEVENFIQTYYERDKKLFDQLM